MSQSPSIVRRVRLLPDSVFFGPHPIFVESIESYWAMQERDIVPQFIVRPRSVQEVATVIRILKRDYDARARQGNVPLLFAVRSGGHSPISRAANADGGVFIGLRLLNTVMPSRDGSSVIIDTKILLRNNFELLTSTIDSDAYASSGGISFFSPRVGFACDNILSYEVVLADGTVTTASESRNPELWRALKGGSKNFGIVTSFVARSFPSTNIWSGFLYMTSSKNNQVINAFHEFTQAKPGTYDEYAGGPLFCFSYVQKLGVNVVSTNLVYTKPESWPACWKGFKSIGRLWSTLKIRSLTSATDELGKLSPPGLRELFITTTVKNDYATLIETYAAYKRGADIMRRVRGMTWTLTLQPLFPAMARKGQPNAMGLGTSTEPLVIILFTVVWKNTADDELGDRTTRDIVHHIDQSAASRSAADMYRYLSDCASWQKPFDGYGAKNKRVLQEMSWQYDPNGLFQRACVGGFKFDMYSYSTPLVQPGLIKAENQTA